MTLQIEHSLFNFSIWRSRPLYVGQELNLVKPNDTRDLDSIADGTILKRKVKVISLMSLIDDQTVKSTDDDTSGEWFGEPYTENRSKILSENQINTENIMFARGFIALLTGYRRKIIYRRR